MNKIVLIGLAALAGLSACTSETQTSRAQRGSIAGGTAGAVAGIAVGGTKATLIGGAVGAAVGGLIGHELDAQQRDLEATVGANGATITNTGAQLIVVLPEAITFGSSSSDLRQSSAKDIGAISASLQKYPNSRVRVIGHTDETGPTAFDQTLSERRAQAVTNVLLASGTPSSRVETFGIAYKQPIAGNDTPEGRALNRRVEIIIIPTGG